VWTATSTYSLKLILNSALWLTAAGVLVRGCGAIREIVFAAGFGVSRDTDCFLLAATYASLLPTVLGGAIATALIARLARLGPAVTAASTLVPLMRGICLAGVAVTAAIYLLAPTVLPLLFSLEGADLERTVSYARILAPLGVTMVLSASMDAILNSAKQFFVPGITSAATPIFMIAAIVAVGGEWGVEAAAWGMVGGGLAEVAVLMLAIQGRTTLFAKRDGHPQSPSGSDFWRAVAFLAISGGIAALAPVIDQMFLAKLETGAITTFNYASKVNSLLIGLFGTAFGVAIYPYLSDLAAQRDTRALRHLAGRITALVVPVTFVASLLVYVFSHEIVQLLFARGNFTRSDTYLVAHIQQIFAFQLVFYVAGLVAMRVLNALGAADFVLWIACLGIVTGTFFNWLLYERLGAGGIALSAVLTSIASLAFALIFIRAALKRGRHESQPCQR
jgi:putative peptidoglycan lipid II flippase